VSLLKHYLCVIYVVYGSCYEYNDERFGTHFLKDMKHTINASFLSQSCNFGLYPFSSWLLELLWICHPLSKQGFSFIVLANHIPPLPPIYIDYWPYNGEETAINQSINLVSFKDMSLWCLLARKYARWCNMGVTYSWECHKFCSILHKI
jgi:hypothetical protein